MTINIFSSSRWQEGSDGPTERHGEQRQERQTGGEPSWIGRRGRGQGEHKGHCNINLLKGIVAVFHKAPISLKRDHLF